MGERVRVRVRSVEPIKYFPSISGGIQHWNPYESKVFSVYI